ncbi:GMC oxidoreductase [Mycobacterium sp. SVM_VP21]|nr:GMC oxidoreductase [Mycobacterium sp. SVM_VP21]
MSQPAGDFDAVVVGSGFGGAVMSARLAEAGMTVLVLERGPWWGAGGDSRDAEVTRPFPRGLSKMPGFLRGLTRANDRGQRVLWSRPTGLFDVHLWPGVTVVVGSGVGGGSLVYAGYQARPAAGFFDQYFPDEISDAEMASYFEMVEAIQRPQSLPYPVASREVFARGLARAGLGSAEAPVMGIQFGDPAAPQWRNNAVGNPQQTCRACGACVIGCEHTAKTTLDQTYLALARRHGADIRALCEVTAIGGTDHRYDVAWRDHHRGTDHVIVTPRLVLAAGTVGTLRLLFAARDKHRSMPALPPALGKNFSGNGDYLAMLSRALPATHEGRHAMFQNVHRLADGGFVGEAAPPVAQLPLPGPVRRWLSETVFLFATGREPGIRLHAADGVPFAPAYKASNTDFYAQTDARVKRIAEAYQPSWFRGNWPGGQRSRRLVTVHPVGGAAIGASPDDGVIDHCGEVFGHPGLFIADGSIYPAAPGVPPSLGIAAMAERQAALMIGVGS